jgi:hypothetical protein
LVLYIWVYVGPLCAVLRLTVSAFQCLFMKKTAALYRLLGGS